MTLSAALLVAVLSPTEVQGRQQGLPDAAARTTLATVRPVKGQVRQAALVARVPAASDEDVPAERGIIDATWVAATPGGFAVVDRLSSSVAFFNDGGEWLGRVGSAGEGPGEFSGGILHAVAVADRLWVPDVRHRRVNIIDIPSRTWLDSNPLDVLQGFPWALLSPGDEVLGAAVMSWGFGSEPRTMSLNLWTGEAMEPAFSWAVDEDRRGWASRTLVVEGNRHGTVAILDRQGGNIRVRDLAGNNLARFVFAEDAGMELSEEDRVCLEALREPVLARRMRSLERRLGGLATEVPTDVARQLTNAARGGRSEQPSPFNDRYPLFLDARFDPESETVWVARPLTADEIRELPVQLGWDVLDSSARYWDAFSYDGSFRYRLEVPVGFVLTDARDGRFYGYEIDPLGTKHAVVLSLTVSTASITPCGGPPTACQ
ncbi:hypothetical protein [Candidatus Palauibacter sp.]|uniref:hypothetical protein n=1 Tax=Candidatus Palauibacter sp. TaxID=3101350 RepID=UPI003B515507